MDTILYLLIFVCLALVVGWYVGNEIVGGAGEWGLLAVRGSETGARAPSAARYQPRDGKAFAVRDGSQAGQPQVERPARFQQKSDRGFRDRDEARYRSRGPLPRFGEKPTRASPDGGARD